MSQRAEEGLPDLSLFLGEQTFEASQEIGRFLLGDSAGSTAAGCGLHCVKW